MNSDTYDNTLNHANEQVSKGLDLDRELGREIAEKNTDNHGNNNPHGQGRLAAQEGQGETSGGKDLANLALLLWLVIVLLGWSHRDSGVVAFDQVGHLFLDGYMDKDEERREGDL